MGATLYAVVEYDDSGLYDPEAARQPPFSTKADGIDLTGFDRLGWGKDYSFFAAISGLRNQSGIEPLYAPRGLPPHASIEVKEHDLIDPDSPATGWLTLGEIEAALAHMGIAHDELSLAVQLVLNMLSFLEQRLGKEHARLVFMVSD